MLRVVEQAPAPVQPAGVCAPHRTLCSVTMHKQYQQMIPMEDGYAHLSVFNHGFCGLVHTTLFELYNRDVRAVGSGEAVAGDMKVILPS